MRSPRFVYLRFRPLTIPATVRIDAVVELEHLGDRAVGVARRAPGARRAADGRRRRDRASPSRTRAAGPCRTRPRGSRAARRTAGFSKTAASGADRRVEVEERQRSLVALAPPPQHAVDDLLEHEQQALARMPERVERTRLHQRLDRALVQRDRVDALAEVVEVDEGTALTPGLQDPARRRPRRRCAPRRDRSGSHRAGADRHDARQVPRR